jgi:hypothetical protein
MTRRQIYSANAIHSGHKHNSNFQIHLRHQPQVQWIEKLQLGHRLRRQVTKQSVDPYNVQGEIGANEIANANCFNLVEEFWHAVDCYG